MPRIRTIKPEFWSDEKLSAMPEATHLLAAALLNYSDDDGFFNAHPSLVKSSCSPLREPSVTIQDSLGALARIDFIRVGTGSDGRVYGQVVNFKKHQVVNRPSPSRIKTLDIDWSGSHTTHGVTTEGSLAEQGTGNREQGTKEASASSTELCLNGKPSVEKSDFIFQTVGKGTKEWALSVQKLNEYEEVFPSLDVAGEMKKAVMWCKDNPRGRKTPQGMLRFLTGWLSRSQNRNPSSTRAEGEPIKQRLMTPGEEAEYSPHG